QFLDDDGVDVAPGGQGLADIARIELGGLHPRAREVRWRIAVDVDNPLTGPEGAAAVFGPQKGADEDDVAALDAGLGHLAQVLAEITAKDQITGEAATTAETAEHYRTAPGFGAAGGIPLALVSLLDAEVVPGSTMVAETVGLEDA